MSDVRTAAIRPLTGRADAIQAKGKPLANNRHFTRYQLCYLPGLPSGGIEGIDFRSAADRAMEEDPPGDGNGISGTDVRSGDRDRTLAAESFLSGASKPALPALLIAEPEGED